MQCRAEIPHLKEIIPDFEGKPVSFISINTRDPKGKADAEIKRYKIDYPVFYGRGQNINRDFKVLKMPRLILANADGSVYKDVLFMESNILKKEIEDLLAKNAAAADTMTTEISKPESNVE